MGWSEYLVARLEFPGDVSGLCGGSLYILLSSSGSGSLVAHISSLPLAQLVTPSLTLLQGRVLHWTDFPPPLSQSLPPEQFTGKILMLLYN